MNPDIQTIIDDLRRHVPAKPVHPDDVHTFQSFHIARLHALVAEEQEKSAAKLEQQTARLIEETVELRRLTSSLYFLTIAVAVFALIQIVIMVLEYCTKLHGSP